jgi:hypothetical protein
MVSLRSDDEVKTSVRLGVRHGVARLCRDGLVKLLEIWQRCQGGCVGNNLTEGNSKV